MSSCITLRKIKFKVKLSYTFEEWRGWQYETVKVEWKEFVEAASEFREFNSYSYQYDFLLCSDIFLKR